MREEGARAALSLDFEKEPGVLSEYLDYLYCERLLTRSTAYNNYMTLRTLAKFLRKKRCALPCDLEEVELAAVDADEMLSISKEEWWAYLDHYEIHNHERKGSLAVRISVVRMFFRWLTAKEVRPLIAFIESEKRPLARNSAVQVVSETMENKIYTALDGDMLMRNACIINMLLHCGLGLLELLALDLEDIELDRVRVRGEYGTRYVPVNEDTVERINAYIAVRLPPKDGTNPFFVSRYATRPRRRSVEKMFCKAAKQAGLVGISIRDLQQTCVQRLVQQGDVESAVAMSRATSQWYVRRKCCARATTAE